MNTEDLDSVIERICNLAADFYGGSNKSMLQLVDESGIDNFPAARSVDVVAACLARNNVAVENWLLWSSNKRVSSGWYFNRESDGYAVGLFPKGEVMRFSEPHVACAEFLLREINALLAVPRKKRDS